MDPKKLTTQQLEQLIRTSKEPFPPSNPCEDPPTSRSAAISQAMKALQDQAEALESRCFQLSTQLQGKSAELESVKLENCSLLDTCRKMVEGQKTLQEEMRLLRLEKVRENEQLQIISDHRRVLEAEIARNMQNYELDREKWQLDIEHFKKILEDKEEKERKLTESMKILTQERTNFESELEKTLKTLEELRKKGEKQRKSLENALSKAESDLIEVRKRQTNSLRELERDNKSLAELCKAQKDTIARLRRENVQQIKTKAAALPPKTTLKVKTARRQSFSATLERPESASSQDSRQQEIEEKKVEAELSLCNSKYTALLQRTQQDGVDGKSIRRELSSLAAEMEAKSQLLYSLKQRRRNA